VASDEGEPLDFGEMGMLDEEMPGGQLPSEGPAATDEGAGPPQAPTEEEGEQEEKPSLSARMQEASPFTVMLGIALLAIVIAVICLALELGSYKWDFSAKQYKESAMAPPCAAQSGPPSTTAAA
jgi:hypothetical protein